MGSSSRGPAAAGTTDRFRVLLVEDSATFAVAVRAVLKQSEDPVLDVEHATTLQAALALLEAGTPDVVLLDLGLPDSQGLDTFLNLYDQAPGIPIVVLTALDDEQVALAAVQAGAQDYLVKGRVSDVLMSLRYALERHRRVESEAAVRARYVAEVAHDLRAPLFAMAARAAAMLRSPAGSDEDVAAFAQSVQRSCRSLGGLADELLDVLRLALDAVRIDPEEVDLSALLTQASADLAPLAEEAGLRLVVDLAPDLPKAEADPHAISRLMANLVTNAVKYTPSGGQVTIRARSKPEWAVIDVSDTGVGIPPDRQATIFDPFVTAGSVAQQPGARAVGLGLAVAKALAEAHGGKLELESAVGVGTTIRLVLPAAG